MRVVARPPASASYAIVGPAMAAHPTVHVRDIVGRMDVAGKVRNLHSGVLEKLEDLLVVKVAVPRGRIVGLRGRARIP